MCNYIITSKINLEPCHAARKAGRLPRIFLFFVPLEPVPLFCLWCCSRIPTASCILPSHCSHLLWMAQTIPSEPFLYPHLLMDPSLHLKHHLLSQIQHLPENNVLCIQTFSFLSGYPQSQSFHNAPDHKLYLLVSYVHLSCGQHRSPLSNLSHTRSCIPASNPFSANTSTEQTRKTVNHSFQIFIKS